jgi:hypothetical protein
MKTKLLFSIAALLAASLLTGCVASTPVGTFSKAASQAATDVANGFDQVQETTITRKMSDLASDTDSPTDSTFTGLLDPKIELAPRLDFLTELKNYAESLGALANADTKTDIDAAAKDLYGSLNGLSETYQKATSKQLPVSAGDTAIIATAVDAIGNAIAEYKRQAALRAIILQANPAIQDVCADLQKTFSDLKKDHFVYENMNSEVADMTSFYKQHTAKWNYEERRAYLEQIRKARRMRDDSDAFIASAADSIAALAKAHKALADSASHGKLTSSEVVKAIGELAGEAAKAKKFYDEIHTKN